MSNQRNDIRNDSSHMRTIVPTFTLDEYEDVKRRAFIAGLDAAWEAVADLTPFVFAYQTWISGDYGYDEGPWVKKENALAAIDALRGES